MNRHGITGPCKLESAIEYAADSVSDIHLIWERYHEIVYFTYQKKEYSVKITK